jgi:hypothetical protein
MTTVLRPLPYVGYEELDDRPHVMVDGAWRPGSVLTLSHWPQSSTPALLARDLSAEIVLDLLSAARRLGPHEPPPAEPTGAEMVGAGDDGVSGADGDDVVAAAAAAANRAVAVTSDHFDEDGLVALYGLVAPEAAIAAAELLVEVAACGDFGVVRSDAAARVCFAIGPLAEEEAGPGSGTSERYSAVLPRLPELLEQHGRFERHWSKEWAAFAAGRLALESGSVAIDEYPDVDLAVVRPAAAGSHAIRGAAGALPVHPAAIHSASAAGRILAFAGDSCELYLRYESWVRVVSRRVPLRPDLGPLAEELSLKEPAGRRWEANGAGAIVSRLQPVDGGSEIDPAVIVATVRDYLASAPPAWDPFRKEGGYIPPGEQARYVSPEAGSRRSAPGRRGRSGRRRA